MRFHPVTRWVYLAPVSGLALVTALSACSSGGSSSTQSPQGAQGSFSAAPTQVHPTAQSAPAVPPGTGSPTPSVGSGSSSAASQITADWNAFFSSATPDSRRVQLLQNGSAFASSIRAFASSPLAAGVTSKVDSVTVTSATQAKVTYDLSALAKTLAKGANGTAVRQDGTWKVGDDVFCGLLSQAKTAGLSIAVPSACSSRS
jgi:ABC-type molybdate transport system substrate-binding protein